MNLSKLYSASDMNLTGHVFDNKDSDESDYDIEHGGSIPSEASEGKDGKNKAEEVAEHQNVQQETNEHSRRHVQQWMRSGEDELEDI